MAEKSVNTDLNMGGVSKVTGLPTPTAPSEAAPKSYVDARTPKITVGTTAPASPALGDVWIDTN